VSQARRDAGNKLKCLLQRQHADLYDLVYSIFVNREIDVNRGEVLSTIRALRARLDERADGLSPRLLACGLQSV
jgi:hypothetical protein